MKNLIVIIFTLSAVNVFGVSLSEIVRLSMNPATIYRARDEIVEMALSDPSSVAVMKVANIVYSKLKILQSATSTPLRIVADAVLKENKDEFYKSLASTDISTLPRAFTLVFNILDIRQDYANFFSHIYDSDFRGALDYFRKLRYTYKIPNLFDYLPKEDTSVLWSFLAQGIQLNSEVFDENAAKFFAAVLTPYEVRTLYMKTYVWLSGLSVQQAEQGLSVVEFESMISNFSEAKMDPNLLQWKYMTSKYLSLYTSITNSIRQLSVAKDLSTYISYAPAFFRAIEEFPAQYRSSLSQKLSTYLDILNQRLSSSKVAVPASIIKDIRNLAVKYPNDPNSSKLMTLTIGESVFVATKDEKKTKKDEIPSKEPKNVQLPYDFHTFLPLLAILFIFLIPRVRLSFYRILRLKGMEMRYYFRRLSKSPGDFKWHLKLASFYERVGKYEEAQREYSLAMKLMKVGGNGYENRQ